MIFLLLFLSISNEDNIKCNDYFCYSYDQAVSEWELIGLSQYFNFSTYGYNHSDPLNLEPNFENDNSPLTSINYDFHTPSYPIQLIIPNTIKYVKAQAFSNVNNILMNITFADDVVIDTGAFEQCQSLISVQFLGNIKKLGDHSFQECSRLQHISAIDTEVISDNAFYNCVRLTGELKFSSKLKIFFCFLQ